MSSVETDQMVGSAGQNMSFENTHPRANEGVLLPEEMQFYTTVKSIDSKNSFNDEFGNTITNYRFEMTDKALYNLRVSQPLLPVTDIAVWKTPAWTTNSRGHNQRTGQQFGRIGLPSVEVSALGEERDCILREVAKVALHPLATLEDLRQVGLARQAHVMLSAVTQADKMGLNSDIAFWFGESRGAMTLMGACAMSAAYDVKIPYALAIAPCFYDGMSWNSLNEQRGQLRQEAANFIRLIGNVSLARLRHYPNTLNASPKSIMYEIAHAPTLFNGDAGKLAQAIPYDQNMQILAYKNDIAGQYAKWQQHFEDYPNVSVRPVPGAHLSIADKRTMNFVTGNFEKIAQQIHNGTEIDSIDYSNIHRRLSTVSSL